MSVWFIFQTICKVNELGKMAHHEHLQLVFAQAKYARTMFSAPYGYNLVLK